MPIVHGNRERLLSNTGRSQKIIAAKVSSWEMEILGTALSTGDKPLPLGVALKISPTSHRTQIDAGFLEIHRTWGADSAPQVRDVSHFKNFHACDNSFQDGPLL